jgi:hypothetical protein
MQVSKYCENENSQNKINIEAIIDNLIFMINSGLNS